MRIRVLICLLIVTTCLAKTNAQNTARVGSSSTGIRLEIDTSTKAMLAPIGNLYKSVTPINGELKSFYIHDEHPGTLATGAYLVAVFANGSKTELASVLLHKSTTGDRIAYILQSPTEKDSILPHLIICQPRSTGGCSLKVVENTVFCPCKDKAETCSSTYIFSDAETKEDALTVFTNGLAQVMNLLNDAYTRNHR